MQGPTFNYFQMYNWEGGYFYCFNYDLQVLTKLV